LLHSLNGQLHAITAHKKRTIKIALIFAILDLCVATRLTFAWLHAIIVTP